MTSSWQLVYESSGVARLIQDVAIGVPDVSEFAKRTLAYFIQH